MTATNRPQADVAPPSDAPPDAHDNQLTAYARDLAVLYRQEKEARQAVEERETDLALLVALHGRLARSLDSSSLISLLVETLVAEFDCNRALAWQYDRQSDTFEFTRAVSAAERSAPEHAPILPMDDPFHRRVMDNGPDLMPLRVITTSTPWLDELSRTVPSSEDLTCIPLHGRAGILGFLIVDGGATSGPRAPILSLFTRQAGILLENAMLYEDSQSELETVRELYDTEQKRIAATHQFDSIVGASPGMQSIFDVLRTIADVDVPVLVLGETGTGKELVARALHFTSKRREKPFVSVNCASIPGELVESELFGHEKGSFTGAQQRRIGKVEMAEGGTLFLDEIAEMPANLQAKLLRFLQERMFERVGGEKLHKANVRIVAATNREIEAAIRENALRPDLIYRLNTMTVQLPPLRERREDIPLLTLHFVEQANEQYQCEIEDVEPSVYDILMRHDWPGNVRELKNVIDRAAILTRSGTIGPKTIQLAAGDLPSAPPESTVTVQPIDTDQDRSMTDMKQEVVADFERGYIDRLLRKSGGNITQAARTAGIDKKNFIEKMKKYEIDRGNYLS